MGTRDCRMFVVGLYLEVDVIHQGQEKCVEVPQKECKDTSQLPLQANARVIILQGSDCFKQRGTKHSEQGHDNFYLRDWESLGYSCHQHHLHTCSRSSSQLESLHLTHHGPSLHVCLMLSQIPPLSQNPRLASSQGHVHLPHICNPKSLICSHYSCLLLFMLRFILVKPAS